MAYEEHPALGLGFLEFSTRPAMSRAGPSSSVYIVWQRKQTNTAKLQLLVLLVGLPRTGTVSGFPAQLSTVRIAGLTTSYTRSIVNYNIFSTTYGLMDSPFNDSVVYPCQISPLQYVWSAPYPAALNASECYWCELHSFSLLVGGQPISGRDGRHHFRPFVLRAFNHLTLEEILIPICWLTDVIN